MLADLRALLRIENIPSPYVLVGHSFGGLLMRLFAHQHPLEVQALFLVDSMHDFATSLRDAHAIGSLGQLPLIVLTAGTFANSKLIPEHSRAGLQQRWEGLQKTFLTLSTNARQSFVRDSGHFMQRDAPGAIIEAIRTVIP